jgi:hypothetical protein
MRWLAEQGGRAGGRRVSGQSGGRMDGEVMRRHPQSSVQGHGASDQRAGAASKVARARHVRAHTRQTSGCSWPPTVTAVPET